MTIPPKFTYDEKLAQILSRINPIIDVLHEHDGEITVNQTELDDLDLDGLPDLTLLFENRLV